jgi:hypothetical protein
VARTPLDGAVVLEKFVAGAAPNSMSGAEFYAMVGHIKRQHGQKGEAIEAELMKIPRQMDKKIRLIDWIGANVAKPPGSASRPPAGTPSGARASPGVGRLDMSGMARLDLSGAMERDVGASLNSARERPQTARAAMGGDAMADLMAGSETPRGGALTARPSTASGAAPPDMSVCLASYLSGRDHLKMSGAEYHSLVAWLMSKGHSDLEADLLKVKMLGDKKLHLVKYIKEKCAELSPGTMMPQMQQAAAPPAEVEQALYAAPPPEPMHMGDAQVLPVHHAPPMQQQQQQPPPTVPPIAAMQQQLTDPIAQAVAVIQQHAATPRGTMPASSVEGIEKLELFMSRLEESLGFAVECMQTDLAHAKEELRKLKASVHGA